MATLYRNMAVTMKAAYAGNFATNCFIWPAWQTQGNGLDFFFTFMQYYNSTFGAPSGDLKGMRVAPYYNTSTTSFTASVASGVMTVTAFGGNNQWIAPGTTVTGAGVPANTTITAQLTGRLGSTGTYQLSNSFTVASEAIACALPAASTIATIQTNLTAMAPLAAPIAFLENFSAIAFSYGLAMGTYEGGWQVNVESSGLTNCGAAQLDSGFLAIENSHKQAVYNAGVTHYTAMESGTFSGSTDNRAPILELGIAFPPTTGNSPKFGSHIAFSGAITPTKNVVSAVGSIVQGYNWCDNTDTTVLGSFSFGSFKVGPNYHSGGYVPYIINVTTAGTYNIDVTFSGVSASPTTAVQVDGSVLATGVAVSNGVVRVKSGVVLSVGPHLLLLGQNGTQTASITQIQFN